MEPDKSSHEQISQVKKFKNIIITREETDKFGEQRLRIDHGALRRILIQPDIGKKPVAFISITGCKRTGKSFILNFILRYLRRKGWENPDWIGDHDTKADRDVDIEWKQSKDRHTTGIRIFEEKFEVPIGANKTMIVMIMDTQGLYDFETPEQMNKAILTLSTLLSSVQIFNVMRHIDAQHLQYLETSVDFAQETSKQQLDNGYLKLERLMILIRDQPPDHDYEDGGFKSTYSLQYGNDHLQSILASEGGGRDQIVVRKKIKKTFNDVSCFPLPHPGKGPERRGFTGSNGELDRDFLDSVKKFVEEIANPEKLKPKRSRHRLLNAREIVNTIAGCDQLFADKMFKASMMVEKNVEGYYASECQEAITEYAKMLEQRLVKAGMDQAARKTAETETRKHALRRYDVAPSMGSEKMRKKYKTELQRGIGECYNNTIKRFETQQKLRQTMVKEHTEAATQQYSKFMEDEIFNATGTESLEKIHQRVTKTISVSLGDKLNTDVFRKQVTESFGRSRDEYAKQLEESIQSKTDAEKRLFSLVQQELREECENMWIERLMKYFQEDELDKHKDDIDTKIADKFWRNAVNATEYKYIRRLYERMEAERDVIKIEAGWCVASKQDEKHYTPVDSGEYYAEKLNELVHDYCEKLKIGITNHSEDSEEYENFENELDRSIEREFYDFCNPDWNPALDKLDRMLEKEYSKAREMHGSLWEQFKESVELVVSNLVLNIEKEFQEKMTDKHLEPGDFAIYFEQAILITKLMPEEPIKDAVEVSKIAKEYYEAVLEDKMNQLRLLLEEANERNKELRPMRDCSTPPPKENSFQKLLGFFKSGKKRPRK